MVLYSGHESHDQGLGNPDSAPAAVGGIGEHSMAGREEDGRRTGRLWTGRFDWYKYHSAGYIDMKVRIMRRMVDICRPEPSA